MINDRKKQHMFGVAELMYKRAPIWGLDSNTMYIAGLLHDIGNLESSENHEVIGANMLRNINVSPNIVFAIEHHGSMLSELDEWNKTSNELLCLVEADLSVDRFGDFVGFQKRLDDLSTRYESIDIAKQNVDFLNNIYIRRKINPPFL